MADVITLADRRDADLECEISAIYSRVLVVQDRRIQRALVGAMGQLIALRSPSQVARMELAIGLREAGAQ